MAVGEGKIGGPSGDHLLTGKKVVNSQKSGVAGTRFGVAKKKISGVWFICRANYPGYTEREPKYQG